MSECEKSVWRLILFSVTVGIILPMAITLVLRSIDIR